jgi:hypothetical protein
MNTDSWICAVLDGASAELLALEQAGQFPAELRVSSRVYQCFTDLRARELSDGLPLLVLGTEVTEDQELAPAEFAVRS